ncbi:MAG TPA: rhomboid family intramembrane serine protease [Candidatus Limnocylindria bacterium]
MTDDPRARLADGQRLLDQAEPEAALPIFDALTTTPDPEVRGAALIGKGTAQYRMDDEAGALVSWQHAAALDGPLAWFAWRSAAEQHVRNGDLEEAIGAYREADRRAPQEERGAIANRIAWLLKETGHDFAARRQFNRARGAYATYPAYVTWGIIIANVIVFLADFVTQGGSLSFTGGYGRLMEAGWIYGPSVADGEYYRLVTSMFLHFGLLHIAFNMYALYLFGPLLEQLYGHIDYLIIYFLCGIGGSVMTILFVPEVPAAGASGAIFGLFGLAFVVSRRRHLLLGPQARAMLSQVGALLVVNLVFTFAIPGISWTGHIGGLLVGAAIGLLLAPTNVPTMGGMWRASDGRPVESTTPAAVRAGTYLLVAGILAAGAFYAVNQVG